MAGCVYPKFGRADFLEQSVAEYPRLVNSMQYLGIGLELEGS